MIIEKVFYDLCYSVDSPVTLGLWLRFCNAPRELAEASIDPLDYSDPVRFAGDYACLAFLRKYECLNTGIDVKEAAILKFRKSEEKCETVNVALRKSLASGQLARAKSSVLYRAQQLMSEIWGRPSFSNIFGRCGWGPGATSSLKGDESSREHKMSQLPVSLTPTAKPYFDAVIKSDILWLRHLLKADVVGPVSLLENCYEFTNSSRLLTVPKDARSDRTICAEPTANIYLQKGVGAYLRSRLRRYDINLDDQSTNQSLAQCAYEEGLSTLDLSAASDTISIGVVKLLCPPEMFDLLERLRSPAYGELDDEVRFHKFSSMGNGFTFELESAIFYCLVRAVAEDANSGHAIGVYGDDIICGREIAQDVITVLEDCGFSINREKSFIDGCFFESCGKHYFKGVDVTPPYQKREVDCDLEYIRMYNRLFDWSQRVALVGVTRPRVNRMLAAIIRNRSETLMEINCFGYAWFSGDGFFKVVKPQSIPFSLNHGYKLTYLLARRPQRILGDGGLYADCMRLSHREDSVAKDQLAHLDGERTNPTNGYCDLRPRERIKQYRVRTRWVPACFGEADYSLVTQD